MMIRQKHFELKTLNCLYDNRYFKISLQSGFKQIEE